IRSLHTLTHSDHSSLLSPRPIHPPIHPPFTRPFTHSPDRTLWQLPPMDPLLPTLTLAQPVLGAGWPLMTLDSLDSVMPPFLLNTLLRMLGCWNPRLCLV